MKTGLTGAPVLKNATGRTPSHVVDRVLTKRLDLGTIQHKELGAILKSASNGPLGPSGVAVLHNASDTAN